MCMFWAVIKYNKCLKDKPTAMNKIKKNKKINARGQSAHTI